jgi:hypothetical protein
MEKLDRLGWVVSQVYRIGDDRIEVRTTSFAFAEWVDHVLRAYRIEQDFEDDPYFSIVVEDGAPSVAGGKRFHILYRRTAAVVRSMDLGTIAGAFLTEIERLRMPLRDDALMLDAAVTEVDGSAVLIPGYLVPTLSSLGRRASRKGIVLPGHSTVQVDADGCVVPLVGVLDVPSDALEGRHGSPSPGMRDDRFAIERRLRVEVVVQLAHEPEVSLRSISRGSVLHRLATQTMNLPHLGGRALGPLRLLVTSASSYETTWMGERRYLDSLSEAVAMGRSSYVDDRSEDTPEGR